MRPELPAAEVDPCIMFVWGFPWAYFGGIFVVLRKAEDCDSSKESKGEETG
jgi:hypothetical protein